MGRARAWMVAVALLAAVAACGGDPVDQPLEGQSPPPSKSTPSKDVPSKDTGPKDTGPHDTGNKGTTQGDSGSGGNQPSATPPTIVASPIDVAHVVSISKFRSCAAHDFSPGVKGHGEPGSEAARSMKHYLQTDIPVDAPNSLEVYAPISGTVEIQEETFAVGKQVYLHANGWSLRIFHIDPTVTDGATVAAGDVIGTLPPANADEMFGHVRDQNGKAGPYQFDIALTSDDNRQYVSILAAMSPDVAAQWAARGFTADSAIISREARDATPCELGPDGERFAQQDYDPADWVLAAG